MQEQPDKTTKAIAYCWRFITRYERVFNMTPRQFLANISAMLILLSYPEDTQSRTRTDHNSLRWILNLSDASGLLAQWRLRLSELYFDVVYGAGIKLAARHQRLVWEDRKLRNMRAWSPKAKAQRTPTTNSSVVNPRVYYYVYTRSKAANEEQKRSCNCNIGRKFKLTTEITMARTKVTNPTSLMFPSLDRSMWNT